MIPLLTKKQKKFIYQSEADLINVALFGMTAKEWKNKFPNLEGNIRDHADILHLVVLSNLEAMNSEMIKEEINQQKRLDKLNQIAIKQLSILYHENNIKKLESINQLQD